MSISGKRRANSSEPAASNQRPPSRMADVARLADVSVITVSRVLREPNRVAESTRTRVLEAVKTIGYVPNLVASSLKSRRSGIVAAIIPSVAHSIVVRGHPRHEFGAENRRPSPSARRQRLFSTGRRRTGRRFPGAASRCDLPDRHDAYPQHAPDAGCRPDTRRRSGKSRGLPDRHVGRLFQPRSRARHDPYLDRKGPAQDRLCRPDRPRRRRSRAGPLQRLSRRAAARTELPFHPN